MVVLPVVQQQSDAKWTNCGMFVFRESLVDGRLGQIGDLIVLLQRWGLLG